jgi:uncharacterized protein YbbC (DUF1343 family)
MRTGLEVCLEDPPAVLDGAQFGLLLNQASVDGRLRYSCDVLAERFPGQLVALFSPQHGLWGEQQANMIESPHARYEPLELPIFSLYSETRRPTEEMLSKLNCFVIDLQDVGTRVYTFVWTMLNCLQACAAAEIPVVILDRPNPLGGDIAEGPLLEPGFESFVGLASIPLRHGLTMAELALLLNHEQHIGAAIEVVRIENWQRQHLWPDTGRAWLPTSPNMTRFETTLVYPGQVLLEGTNLSEGRGTTLPFEVCGAPFLDPFRLAKELEAFDLPGLTPRPIRFVPTFDKWRGQSCGGIAWQIIDSHAVRSVQATLAFLAAAQRLAPNEFAWTPPPYEYETVKQPIDILWGSSRLRERFATGQLSPEHISSLTSWEEAEWSARTAPFRLYAP